MPFAQSRYDMKVLLVPIILCTLECTPASAAETSPAAGKILFAENCGSCHGVNAWGDGIAAARLTTPPADLTEIAARRSGVWPMLEVMSIIDGYTKRTMPREDMPVITDLSEGARVDFDTGNGQVTSVPARLIALANYLESIQMPRPNRYVP